MDLALNNLIGWHAIKPNRFISVTAEPKLIILLRIIIIITSLLASFSHLH